MAQVGRMKITLSIGATGAVILLGAGITSWQPIRESWYLSRLESPDTSVQRAAAHHLAELGSTRAVPRLLELLQEEEDRLGEEHYAILIHASRATEDLLQEGHRDREWEKNWPGQALSEIGTPALPRLFSRLDSRRSSFSPWVSEVLLRMGPGARPALYEALQNGPVQIRSGVAIVLGARRSRTRDDIRALREALSDRDPRVQLAAMLGFRFLRDSTHAVLPELRELRRTGRTVQLDDFTRPRHPHGSTYYPWVRPEDTEISLAHLAKSWIHRLELIEETRLQARQRRALRRQRKDSIPGSS